MQKIYTNPSEIKRFYQKVDLILLKESHIITDYSYSKKGRGHPLFLKFREKPHIKFDLKYAYESISYSRIVGLFRKTKNIKNPIHRASRHTTNGTLMRGGLASAYIFEVCLIALDYRLAGLAKQYNAKYYRYMDDFIFVFEKIPFDQLQIRICSYIVECVLSEGFHLNIDKTTFHMFTKSTDID